jgi:hypothetical protein
MENKSKSNSPEVKAAEIWAEPEEDTETEIEEASEEEVTVIMDSEEEMTEDHEEILVIDQKDASIVVKTVILPETAVNVIFILFSEKTKRIQQQRRR